MLSSGAPVIPVATDGSYFRLRRAHVAVGCPVDVRELMDPSLDEKGNLKLISEKLRQRIIELEKLINEPKK